MGCSPSTRAGAATTSPTVAHGRAVDGGDNDGHAAWAPPPPPPPNPAAPSHWYLRVDHRHDGTAPRPLSTTPLRYLRVSHSAVSVPGRPPRPPPKPNQDAWLAVHNLGGAPGVGLWAVFDGHGPRGEDAAHYCRAALPGVAVRKRDFPRSPRSAVASSLQTLHDALVGSPPPHAPPHGGGARPSSLAGRAADASVSGSTANVFVLDHAAWLCANVGDSRAMMGSDGGGGGARVAGPQQPHHPPHPLTAHPLSVDHKPDRPDERARIEAGAVAGSAVILSEAELGVAGGDGSKLYVCRVANRSVRYGVLFTRSVGDADAHAFLGLTATPEVSRGVLAPADKFVVLATDGVWDALDEDAGACARVCAQEWMGWGGVGWCGVVWSGAGVAVVDSMVRAGSAL
jgi:serine/threonine protein phosphatase PrpC